MFFDGYPDKGRCPAGDAHLGRADLSTTLNFVLPHPIHPRITLYEPLARDGRLFAHVKGAGYTPNSRVELHGAGGTRAEAPTDVRGNFAGLCPVTGPWARFGGVRVIDVVTGDHSQMARPA